ncbi:MAG: hypothetical protein H0W02_03290 [Ktedonobacteraceae bacterium]|nr:hypothetical protein [Ktedonobacteraceae bacterium]
MQQFEHGEAKDVTWVVTNQTTPWVVVVMQNDLCEEMPVRLVIDNRMIAPTLPADSFNTFVIPPAP